MNKPTLRINQPQKRIVICGGRSIGKVCAMNRIIAIIKNQGHSVIVVRPSQKEA